MIKVSLESEEADFARDVLMMLKCGWIVKVGMFLSFFLPGSKQAVEKR